MSPKISEISDSEDEFHESLEYIEETNQIKRDNIETTEEKATLEENDAEKSKQVVEEEVVQEVSNENKEISNNETSEVKIVPPTPLTETEIEERVKESESYKATGNQLFATGEYENAIEKYNQALGICPEERPTLRALFYGNIAASYMKLERWDDAVHACDSALELDSTYIKALVRRAQANEKIGKYLALSSALEDYKKLNDLAPNYRRECEQALRRLPPRIEEQQEIEKAEMLDKVKDLGNRFLGMFGLSTDNFQMQKDPASGNYSMQFKH